MDTVAVRVVAVSLLELLTESYVEHAGTETLFLEDAFNKFVDECAEYQVDVVSALNLKQYLWYHGNIAHGILVYLNFPFFEEDPPRLTRLQAREAINLLHTILIKYDVNLDEKDYYDLSVKQMVLNIRSGIEPTILHKDEIELLYSVVFRTKKMAQVRSDAIKRYIAWKREQKRRKRAALVICTYLQELVLSPYTFIGAKMLQIRSKQFYNLAVSMYV